MTTTLLIDIGNSYLKWGLDSGYGVVGLGGTCRTDINAFEVDLLPQFQGLHPAKVLVSCVSDRSVLQGLTQCLSAFDWPAMELLTATAQDCGVRNAYVYPERLGSDRWAAMIAGFDCAKGPVCVVGCGTAITIDAVNAEGSHLGGLITPGYGLLVRSLQQGTNIHFHTGANPLRTGGLGLSTEECILQGTTQSISALVAQVFGRLRGELPPMSLILTGGDAQRLQSDLSIEARIEPNLVLRGMALIQRSGGDR